MLNERMRRALSTACALAFVAAPSAWAAEVSGELVFCQGGDYCRYFPQPRLDVTFIAAPDERNELRMLPHVEGVRIIDAGADIKPGAFCTAVSANDVRCGPPAPEGLVATAFTGDGRDSSFARIGSVYLGAGRDFGLAAVTSVDGGPGDDKLRAWGDGSVLTGGAGRDELLGSRSDQALAGGPGNDFIFGGVGVDQIDAGAGADQIAGGRGRDEIHAGSGDDFIRASDPDRDTVRCGRGNDRVFISGRDRVFGCERVAHGWDN